MINGTPDKNFPAVGAIVKGGLRGSGLLITPKHVLTSATVANAEGGSALHFVLGPTLTAPEEQHGIASVQVHPGHNPGTGDYDIAIVELESPSARSPLPLLSPADPQPAAGAPVTVVGYGAFDESGGGSGMRRRGTVTVLSLDEQRIHLSLDPVAVSFGDSGGPVLFYQDGEMKVAAINTAISPSAALAIRVSAAWEHLVGPVLDPTPFHGVGIQPDRPIPGYPMRVIVALKSPANTDLSVDLSLRAPGTHPQFAASLPPVTIPAGAQMGHVDVPAVVLADRTYAVAASLGGSSILSDPFTARSHAKLASISVEPDTVPPGSPFTLSVVLEAPLAEPIVVPIEIVFPNGDMTAIGVTVEGGTTTAAVTPTIGPAPGVVTFAAGFHGHRLVETLTVTE